MIIMNDKYILMCKEAKEIQNWWKPKVGDKAVDIEGMKDAGVEFIIECDIVDMKKYFDGDFFKDYVWLPRQEDLQKICKKNNIPFGAHRIGDWFKEKMHFELIGEKGNWNLLWLMFTMEKVYGKQWNGETWVKI